MSEVHEGGCICNASRYRVKGDPFAGLCVLLYLLSTADGWCL